MSVSNEQPIKETSQYVVKESECDNGFWNLSPQELNRTSDSGGHQNYAARVVAKFNGIW
jgi:hypothetical protein